MLKKKKKRKGLKFLLFLCLVFVVVLATLFVYLAIVAIEYPPQPTNTNCLQWKRKQIDSNCYTLANNWIRKSESGLWEMYIEGNAFERGVLHGKLAKELVYYQESAFSEQINSMIPSTYYRNFLKYFIAWFNRDLADNLTEEQKLEIYGVSISASPEFNDIGSAYQRLLNYHAAHDIGHALQNMALVGCSSFATWKEKSQDGLLLIGRNFDFYVGDKFAENKIVEFCKPNTGYPFVSITWGGMTGVLSGMNTEGLTVTINAAKSPLPSGSATPISLLSREILQYAKNIDDAVKIAKKRKTFVSESLLIGSAHDQKAVVIEKTPDTLDVYISSSSQIICTNHYQSELLKNQSENKEQMETSASVYRYKRMEELISENAKNTPQKCAELLRNQYGINNEFIGWGNEKAVNQLIAHHSIIFSPMQKKIWISTSSWQLGKYVAYDLNKIFAMKGLSANKEIYEKEDEILADSFLNTKNYRDFILFRTLKTKIQNNEEIDVQQLIQSNPQYYHTYVLAGDYLVKKEKYAEAKKKYAIALTKVVATKTERDAIREKIEQCTKEEE